MHGLCKLTEEQEADLARRYAGGESSLSLAAHFGLSRTSVRRILVRRGVPRRQSGKAPVPEAKRAEARRLYRSGMTLPAVSAALGIAKDTIRKTLWEVGDAPRTTSDAQRKYALDESAFDELTPEALYWVGFLLADGCVSDRIGHGGGPTVSLSLASRDHAHVEKFARFLGTDKPVRTVAAAAPLAIAGRTARPGPTARLAVSSRRLVSRLAPYGVVPRKSTREQPHPALVGDRDFWRGVVDGDGAVYLAPYKWAGSGFRPRLALTGSLHLCLAFREFARGVTGRDHYLGPNGPRIWEVATKGVPAALVIRRLYEGAATSLDRKQRIADQVIASDWIGRPARGRD